jgi:hypothetical protein
VKSAQRAWCSSAENLSEVARPIPRWQPALPHCLSPELAGGWDSCSIEMLVQECKEWLRDGKWKGERGTAGVFQSTTCFVPIATKAAYACCYNGAGFRIGESESGMWRAGTGRNGQGT